MNNWETLCRRVRYYTVGNHNSGMDEEGFECHYREYLQDIFGWSEEEIKRQYTVYFGHEEQNPKRTDIVALFGEYPSIVFEFKWKVNLEEGDARLQLFSYIKQLEAEFGVLTNGIAFQLFYKPLGRKGGPWKVFGSNYNKDDKTGTELGNLLTRSNYNEEKMRAFCEALLKKEVEKKKGMQCFKPDRPNHLMEEQMSKELDDKMLTLIKIYKDWLTSSDNQYIKSQEEAGKWVMREIFNNSSLSGLGIIKYRTLIREIPSHLTNLKDGACRTLYKNSLSGDGRKRFLRAIKLINNTKPEDCFNTMEMLVSDENYRIKGLGQSFWSELLRCKFPNMPLVNSKTARFFQLLELYIGVNPMEQHENVYYCYNRWRSFYPGDVSMLELSHMEHFALADEEGKRVMKELFEPLAE